MSAIAGLSQILSGLALAGFSGATLWLLMRPRARMAALMPAPRWQVAAAAATALWCAALTIFSPGTSEALVVQIVASIRRIRRSGRGIGARGDQKVAPSQPSIAPSRTICTTSASDVPGEKIVSAAHHSAVAAAAVTCQRGAGISAAMRARPHQQPQSDA